MAAGNEHTGTVVAFTASATIMPTPSSLMVVTPEMENVPTTMISNSAALVITPPGRCTPPATAAVLSSVTSYRPRIRDGSSHGRPAIVADTGSTDAIVASTTESAAPGPTPLAPRNLRWRVGVEAELPDGLAEASAGVLAGSAGR